MRLDESEYNVTAVRSQPVRLFEHAVGFADAGGATQINLQGPLFVAWDEVEERLRIGTILVVHSIIAAIISSRLIRHSIVNCRLDVTPPSEANSPRSSI